MAGEKALLSVDEALERILASVGAPLESESVPLAEALGRTLAADVIARRTQPPFDVSAMDGYAVRAVELAPGKRVRLVGESAAGKGYDAPLGAGETVRIFTGAPVPPGADAILSQEDASVEDGWVSAKAPPGPHIRAKGLDFSQGEIGALRGDAARGSVVAKHSSRRHKLPRARGDAAGNGSQLLQRREPPAQEPDQRDAGGGQQ